ncbi:hypothetical protein [Burkholderia ambifaria]
MSMSHAAIAREPNAIELRAVGAHPPASIGVRDARAMLAGLEKVTHRLTASLAKAADVHRRVTDELRGPGPDCLTEENRRKIDDARNFIATAGPVKALLERLVGDLESQLAAASTAIDAGASSKVSRTQRRIALAEMVGAIAAKNAAWYALPGLIPATHVRFDNVGEMTKLVTSRSALALLFAAVTEYPLATDGQRRFKDAGGQINQLQGFVQALDQAFALAILFGINKATGQEPPPGYQVAGFALSAAGAAFQTGALNGLIIRMLGPVFDTLSKKSARPSDDRSSFLPTHTSRANPAPPEQSGIRNPEPSLNTWLDTVPAQDFAEMNADLDNACASIARLHDAIFPREHEVLPRDMHLASPAADYGTHVERFSGNFAAIRSAVRAFRNDLPDDDERLTRIDAALAHAQDAERTIAELRDSATPRRTAFFAAMAILSTVGSVLGAIGPSVQNAWLSDINHRAAIFGVTSSVLQAFANLGQFLGGAKPGDGRLARFLKIGMENDQNPYRAWTKNWLRSVRFLLGEFPLLQLSTTFSEMANKEAGKLPQAPVQGTPSAYTIRNVQEAFRAIFSLAFTALALGEKANWNHYLGLGIAALGAIVPTVIEYAGTGARNGPALSSGNG